MSETSEISEYLHIYIYVYIHVIPLGIQGIPLDSHGIPMNSTYFEGTPIYLISSTRRQEFYNPFHFLKNVFGAYFCLPQC